MIHPADLLARDEQDEEEIREAVRNQIRHDSEQSHAYLRATALMLDRIERELSR